MPYHSSRMARNREWRSLLSALRHQPYALPRQDTLHGCRAHGGRTFPHPASPAIHECRREAFETEARRGCSHVRPRQAYWQSVEEAEREQPRRGTGSDAGAAIHEESWLEQFAQPMLLDHAFDRLPIDAGFPGRSPHVAVVTLEEIDQKTALKGRHGRLLGMLEGTGFAGD